MIEATDIDLQYFPFLRSGQSSLGSFAYICQCGETHRASVVVEPSEPVNAEYEVPCLNFPGKTNRVAVVWPSYSKVSR